MGIYVHIPFCEKKCFYCDFYSLENHTQRGEFIDAIVKEIRLFSENHPRYESDTIFFGGGTPSLLTPAELEKILQSLHDAFDVAGHTEFTMECNPGAIDTAFLSNYKALGANRLSFGVQSFFEDELRFLERIHTAAEAVKAVELARGLGYGNVNVDLMYALPGQTHERLLANLQRAVSLGTDHISAYGLIVEPGTPLFAAVARGEIAPAPESIEAEMYRTVMEFMGSHGYSHYEISNYARPGFECRHNLKYWNAEEYAGFGPSAHSYIGGQRWWNVSSLTGYIADLRSGRTPVSARETLTRTQMLDEFVLLHLRQGKLDMDTLRSSFGIALSAEFISDMLQSGYCEISGKSLHLTKRGFAVSDEIAETLLARHSLPA
jgi:putative oxygen-independent coproporphyrinogen III oxidase